VQKTTYKGFGSLKVAILGADSKKQAAFQCMLCHTYRTNRRHIVDHLRKCLCVALRFRNTTYQWPEDASGKAFCPICGHTP
jgi:hypothetical protein